MPTTNTQEELYLKLLREQTTSWTPHQYPSVQSSDWSTDWSVLPDQARKNLARAWLWCNEREWADRKLDPVRTLRDTLGRQYQFVRLIAPYLGVDDVTDAQLGLRSSIWRELFFMTSPKKISAPWQVIVGSDEDVLNLLDVQALHEWCQTPFRSHVSALTGVAVLNRLTELDTTDRATDNIKRRMREIAYWIGEEDSFTGFTTPAVAPELRVWYLLGRCRRESCLAQDADMPWSEIATTIATLPASLSIPLMHKVLLDISNETDTGRRLNMGANIMRGLGVTHAYALLRQCIPSESTRWTAAEAIDLSFDTACAAAIDTLLPSLSLPAELSHATM